MIWIDRGNFIVKPPQGIVLSEKDDKLMLKFDIDTLRLFPFYISQAEITNKEYHQFVEWVKDSVIRSFLALRDEKYYSDVKHGILDKKRPIDWTHPDLESFFISQSDRYTTSKVFNPKFLNYGIFYVDSVKSIVNVYPDTAIWTKEYPFSYMQPMSNNYFQSPVYDDYPVIGISYIQANAYCNWKTNQLREVFKSEGIAFPEGISYRLPLDFEWEYAALSNDFYDFERVYPWKGTDFQKNGSYLCNYGTVTDNNNIQIKKFQDDGALLTNPVDLFPTNENNLYNMAGNVSEWVGGTSKIYLYYHKVFAELSNASNHQDTMKVMLRFMEKAYGNCYVRQYMNDKSFTDLAEQYLRKIQSILYSDYSIAKGGSWADQPTSLMSTSYTILPSKNYVSSHIGFRMVLETYGVKITPSKKVKHKKNK